MASTSLPTPSSTSSGGGGESNSRRYCFDVAQFAAEGFDPAAFVTAAKEGASLEVLRDHLRGYQKDLREELYEVINRDLADFLKLSSKACFLSGVDHEVLEIRAPLQELLVSLQEAQDFATGKRQALHDRLQERGSLRHRKGTLQRRIRFLHTLGDVEAALNMPGASASSRARRPPLQDEIRDGDIAEHCGSLERLAHAWLSLAADLPAFPAAGAEEEDDVPTAAAMGLRLQRAERALLVRLAAAFRVVICPQDLVVAAVKGGGSGEEDASSVEPIAVNEPALRHCLRAFLVVGRGDEAERQVARLVMLPFVDLNFTQGRLDGGARGSCAGLPGIYAACLQHARHNLGSILQLAETLLPPATANVGLDLVGNGVWRPVHQALCARQLAGPVFAPGIADILHANYTVTARFLSGLASLAGPQHEAAIRRRLKTHPCTLDLSARWNLPVYFHLRFTEVSARVDRAFQQQQGQTQTQPAEEKKDDDAVGQQLTHPAFVAVWRELKGLWAPSVFLAPLTPRLFKLALQIVGRFHHWLDEALTQAVTTTPYPSSPAPNLLPADQPEALVAFAWDAVVFSGEPAVKHLVALALQAVAAARAEEGQEQGGEGEVGRLLEEGLAEAMAPFAGLAMRAWELLHERVVGQCVTALQGVKGVTATYRMTNKRPPERACPYVGKVLDPLRALEPEVKGRVPPALASVWRPRIVTAVTERYLELTKELLSSVQQMEDALKKRKQRAKGGSSISGSSVAAGVGLEGGGEAGMPLSDSEKIQLQLLLDVAAFAGELGGVGGMADPLKDCAPYVRLLRAVAPARLLLRRPDVHATLPPAIEAFLSSSSSSLAVTGTL